MRWATPRFTTRGLLLTIAGIGLTLAAFQTHLGLGILAAALCGLAFWSGSEERFYRIVLKLLIGYGVVCALTIPFIDGWWLGEIPPLALIQLPKIDYANHLRSGIVMETIKRLGWSRGSFSPDYELGRPYALAIAYLVPLAIVLVPIVCRTRLKRPFGWLVALLLVVAAMDYGMTLAFATQRSFSIY